MDIVNTVCERRVDLICLNKVLVKVCVHDLWTQIHQRKSLLVVFSQDMDSIVILSKKEQCRRHSGGNNIGIPHKYKKGVKHIVQHTGLYEEDKVYLQELSTSPVLGFQHKIRLSLALLNSNSGSAWHQETDRIPLKQTGKKSVVLHNQPSLSLCQ